MARLIEHRVATRNQHFGNGAFIKQMQGRDDFPNSEPNDASANARYERSRSATVILLVRRTSSPSRMSFMFQRDGLEVRRTTKHWRSSD